MEKDRWGIRLFFGVEEIGHECFRQKTKVVTRKEAYFNSCKDHSESYQMVAEKMKDLILIIIDLGYWLIIHPIKLILKPIRKWLEE